MAERDQAGRQAMGVQDLDAFREACSVFGDEGALAHLRRFRQDLAEHLRWIGQGQPDQVALAKMAHKTAGRSGVLGFPALADACAGLEEAVRARRGVAAALDHWKQQARLAAEAPRGNADAIASGEKTADVLARR